MAEDKKITTFSNSKNGKSAEEKCDHEVVTYGVVPEGGRFTREDVDAQIDRLLKKHQRALDALAKL